MSFAQALESIGYNGTEVGNFLLYAAYKLHIEQGAILERIGHAIGVVTAGQGRRWYEVTLEGSTPTALRCDALASAAKLIGFVERPVRSRAPYGRATVGMIFVRCIDGLGHNEPE